MLKIGIIGRKRDPQVLALNQALAARGVQPLIIDFHNFPRFNLATLDHCCAYDDINQPQAILLNQLDLIHLRSICFEDLAPAPAGPPPTHEVVAQHYRDQAAKAALQIGLAQTLADRLPVINPPDSFLFHRQKACQHQLLLGHQIPTPRAIITNDLSQIKAFVANLKGRVVVKPQASGAEVVLADETYVARHARQIEARPFIFQQYVKGRSLRAYTIGGTLVSMGQIHHDHRHVDWRERIWRVEPYAPAPDLVAQIQRAVRLLKMPCCGIDLEYDHFTERTYFLDFNPSALFVRWSQWIGVDLADRMAAYFIAVVNHGGQLWLEDF